MSLGFPVGMTLDQLTGLPEALECAQQRGVVVVAAAGNEGAADVAYPAKYPTVIAVGATTIDERYAWYSNRNADIDVVAPGGENCSDFKNLYCALGGTTSQDYNRDGYVDAVVQQTFQIGTDPNVAANWAYYFLEGTSMASPHVAGVAALVRGINPGLNASDTRAILENTADNLGPAFGHGLINAATAAQSAYESLGNNHAPIAQNDSTTTTRNVPVTVAVLANDTDSDGDALTVVLEGGASNGVAVVNGDQTVTYTPSPDYLGTGSFSYRAYDGIAYSGLAVASITVLSPNLPPVASAGIDWTVDEGAAVTFDGSGSSDPDGTIVSYQWSFGDGTGGTGTKPTHTYVDNGTYIVTLTVTDDRGATGTDGATVVVNNVAPVAQAGGPYSGNVAQPIAFVGSAVDPGVVDTLEYSWDFGDGTTGTGATVSHSYAAAGTYLAKLTVHDKDGAWGQDSATVTVVTGPIAYVTIDLSTAVTGKSWKATAKVTIRETNNASGPVIRSAIIDGNWTGAYSASVSGVTSRAGVATFKTGAIGGAGSVTFTVDHVAKDGQIYTLVGTTSASITQPLAAGH